MAEADRAGVVGFAAWHEAELGQLFIEPSWFGIGLRRLLLFAAEAAMSAGGVEEVHLTCVVGNGEAQAFYQRHGWLDSGVESYPAQVAERTVPVLVRRMTKRLRF